MDYISRKRVGLLAGWSTRLMVGRMYRVAVRAAVVKPSSLSPRLTLAPMASSSAKFVSRLSSIALKFNNKTASFSNASPLKAASKPAINKRLISRLPVELSSSLDSMLPLHNAIASARLQSSLSAESQRWGLVPQGISMPL